MTPAQSDRVCDGVLSAQSCFSPQPSLINSSIASFSLVSTIGVAFRIFGAANKGLVWKQVAIKPGTNVVYASLFIERFAIFSNNQDFAVYVSTTRVTCPLATYGGSISPWLYVQFGLGVLQLWLGNRFEYAHSCYTNTGRTRMMDMQYEFECNMISRIYILSLSLKLAVILMCFIVTWCLQSHYLGVRVKEAHTFLSFMQLLKI